MSGIGDSMQPNACNATEKNGNVHYVNDIWWMQGRPECLDSGVWTSGGVLESSLVPPELTIALSMSFV